MDQRQRLPGISRHALAGVAPSDAGELAFKRAREREAVQPFLLGGSGDKCCVWRLRCAVHDKGGAWQRQEGRTDIAVGVVVVGPGQNQTS